MLSSSYPCLWSLLKQSMLLNILKHRNSEKLRKLLSHHLKTEPTITQPNEERSLTRRETAAVAARRARRARLQERYWAPGLVLSSVKREQYRLPRRLRSERKHTSPGLGRVVHGSYTDSGVSSCRAASRPRCSGLCVVKTVLQTMFSLRPLSLRRHALPGSSSHPSPVQATPVVAHVCSCLTSLSQTTRGGNLST